MTRSSAVLLAITIFVSTTFLNAQTQPAQPTTLSAMVEREISAIEKQVVEVAEAMPESKFNFTPESLTIPGDDYKGVRSFAAQVKHIASSNYFIGLRSPAMQSPPPSKTATAQQI